MQIHLHRLGPLQHAKFTLGDLTVICGNNNTGKTYATYALFGFLSFWQDAFSIPIQDEEIAPLLAKGVVSVDLNQYVAQAETILKEACLQYTRQLPRVFAASPERFTATTFQITVDDKEIQQFAPIPYERKILSAGAEQQFSISKPQDSHEMVVALLGDKVRLPPEIIKQFVGRAIKDILFKNVFPVPFIASAERTGAAIFRKELNFQRNRLLEEMAQTNRTLDPMELLFKVYQDYALPVKENVDFTRDLETTSKQMSFIAKEHPELLQDFSSIIGGDYVVTRNDELYYKPQNGKRLKLSMDASSSAVRSLLVIGFYLRHVARPADLLLVDEPELNLHPENQRRVARLFARLIHLGVKIFITTHSDYIIREFNTLIMLNQDKPRLRRLAANEGYRPDELLSPEQIKVYIAENKSPHSEKKTRKTQNGYTLNPAKIDLNFGIDARSFDTTIQTMNRIQEEIIWGDA